jgi:hypothetical protein
VSFLRVLVSILADRQRNVVIVLPHVQAKSLFALVSLFPRHHLASGYWQETYVQVYWRRDGYHGILWSREQHAWSDVSFLLLHFWNTSDIISLDVNSAEYQQVICNCPFACSALTYFLAHYSIKRLRSTKMKSSKMVTKKSHRKDTKSQSNSEPLPIGLSVSPCHAWISSPF